MAEHSPDSSGGLMGWAIGPVLVCVAAWLLWGPTAPGAPDLPERKGNPAAWTDAPLRTPIADPPITRIGPYDQTCQHCHAIRETPPDVPQKLTQHQSVVLNHGLNNQCLNCHSRGNRDLLQLRDGTTINFTQSPQLCADCHGTTFHDWKRGTHGRTTGSWDADDPRFERLLCVACHDPHSPALGPMDAWPAPNTLRFDPESVTEHDPFDDGRHHPLHPARDGGPAKEANH